MKSLLSTDPGNQPRLELTATPRLLVSVRNLHEARQAVAGGADWIDLKDPHQGPLGPVDATAAHKVAKAFSTSHPLSAAAGELRSWQTQGTSSGLGWKSPEGKGQPSEGEGNIENKGNRLLNVPGIQLLKLGLAGCGDMPHWQDQWSVAQREIHKAGKRLVAVVYADWQEAAAPHPEQIVEHATDNQCEYLLIDTFCKTEGTLLDCLRADELALMLEHARKASIRTVVAGSLSIASLPHLLTLPIDLVAVRGAVCTGGRDGTLQRNHIEQFQGALKALPWRRG